MIRAVTIVVIGLLVSPALADDMRTVVTPPLMGEFLLSPAPCDAVALTSNGWCMDVATFPNPNPPIPGIPPAPVITGPFATINTKTAQLTGTGVPGDIIAVAIDNILDPGLVTVAPSGSWTFNTNTPLANGPHVALAIQRNGVGPSPSSAPLSFAVAAP